MTDNCEVCRVLSPLRDKPIITPGGVNGIRVHLFRIIMKIFVFFSATIAFLTFVAVKINLT